MNKTSFKGMVEGISAVTTILGPWDEPYVKNMERNSTYFHVDITTISIEDLVVKKREYQCQSIRV